VPTEQFGDPGVGKALVVAQHQDRLLAARQLGALAPPRTCAWLGAVSVSSEPPSHNSSNVIRFLARPGVTVPLNTRDPRNPLCASGSDRAVGPGTKKHDH